MSNTDTFAVIIDVLCTPAMRACWDNFCELNRGDYSGHVEALAIHGIVNLPGSDIGFHTEADYLLFLLKFS